MDRNQMAAITLKTLKPYFVETVMTALQRLPSSSEEAAGILVQEGIQPGFLDPLVSQWINALDQQGINKTDLVTAGFLIQGRFIDVSALLDAAAQQAQPS